MSHVIEISEMIADYLGVVGLYNYFLVCVGCAQSRDEVVLRVF